LTDAIVSEKHTVSIFRAEFAMLGSGGIYISPPLHSTRRQNPEEDYRHPHRHDNLKSYIFAVTFVGLVTEILLGYGVTIGELQHFYS
jgi:hypothetical protein